MRCRVCPFAVLILLSSAASTLRAQAPVVTLPNVSQETLPIGVPLHWTVSRTTHLRVGDAVEGQVTQSVYAVDRMVLPSGAIVRGSIASLEPIRGRVRQQALLNGDVTPLKEPVVALTSAVLLNGTVLPLQATARIRATTMVSFNPAQKTGLIARAKAAVQVQIDGVEQMIFAPGKKDRALRLLYGQLPYHPQRLWAGTQLIADLDAPAEVPVTPAPAAMLSQTLESLNGLEVTARLVDAVSSATAKKGDAVHAVIAEPVFGNDKTLLLPVDSAVDGVVLSAKPARKFGHNGQLHFTIRSVERAGSAAQHVEGTLSGAEGNNAQNVTVDREGDVKSNPDAGRFLAPALLALTAAAGGTQDSDGPGIGRITVGSNGFGLVARVIALTAQSRPVAIGFGAYAFGQSVYFRFLTKGHEVEFPKDTMVTLKLASR